jgi:hypothetical protein
VRWSQALFFNDATMQIENIDIFGGTFIGIGSDYVAYSNEGE